MVKEFHTLADLGEFGLIRALSQRIPVARPNLLRGIGDDAAVWRLDGDRLMLFTTDMLVEGVHFQREWGTPEQLGWKAVAVNVSDIAAMGGQPDYALISLGVPEGMPVEELERLYAGMDEAARAYELAVVGGDVVKSPERLVINVALTGEVSAAALTLRSGAQVGDAILVTNTLGDSAAGLHLLLHGTTNVPTPAVAAVQAAHLQPRPPLRAAQAAARTGRVTAMMDLSDGLAGDLRHIAEESGVGAGVQAGALPLSEACRTVAAAVGQDPLRWALRGGEDYELLLTCAPAAVAEVSAALRTAGATVSVIGEITAPPALWLETADGERRPLGGGYDHFSP